MELLRGILLFFVHCSHIPAHRETFPKRGFNLSYSLDETDASEHLPEILEVTFRNQTIMFVRNSDPTRTKAYRFILRVKNKCNEHPPQTPHFYRQMPGPR